MTEIWKDVVGYEGLYQVSNLGRVKSLPKMVGFRYQDEKLTAIFKDKRGYCKTNLYKNNKHKQNCRYGRGSRNNKTRFMRS